MNDPQFLSVDDVCRILCISRSTLYRLFETGEISRVKIGAKVLIPSREVQKFVDGVIQKGSAET